MRNFGQLATIIIILVSTLVFGGLIDHLVAQSGKGKKKDPPKSRISDLFKEKCAKCHGTDGKGETVEGAIAGAPDFTRSEWQEKVNDQELAIVIEQGRAQMPSFRNKLTKEQIKALITHIRAFKSN